MSIDIKSILAAHKVDFITSGPEVTRGWVNMRCPFCGDHKHHLGYSDVLDLFSCWKCGVKNSSWALAKVLGVPVERAKRLAEKHFIAGSKTFEKVDRPKEVRLPENHGRLLRCHREYLESRSYDPRQLAKDWELVGGDGDWEDRILIPIRYKGDLVSFHSRSIFDDDKFKAKPCPSEAEVIRHKDLLYGFDMVPGNTVVVVEGPADVWRLGRGAVATFGTKFTEHQISLLSAFKNVFVMFDSELDEEGNEKELSAQKQSERLADKLAVFSNVWVIGDLGSDPGDLSERKAARLMKRIGKIAEEAV